MTLAIFLIGWWFAISKTTKDTFFHCLLNYWQVLVLDPRWLRVSLQSSPSSSLKCKSCPSWCHRSSLPRQRRMTCSGGRSLCGNPPGASVGRSPTPWRRGLSCSPSRPTCPAGGSTRHSPWCLLPVCTVVVTHIHKRCFSSLLKRVKPCFQQRRHPTLSNPTPGHHELKVQLDCFQSLLYELPDLCKYLELFGADLITDDLL